MSPLPKRRHSNMRSGKRTATKKRELPQIMQNEKGETKLSHRTNA